MALAQSLAGDSEQPQQQVVNGLVMPVSGLERASKGLNKGLALALQGSIAGDTAKYAEGNTAAIANMLSGGRGVGGLSVSPENAALIAQLDPESAIKGYIESSKPTDVQKNYGWSGMTGQDYATNQRAEAAKNAGISGGILQNGPNGPMATPIAGAAQTNAGYKGAEAGAVAGAQAGFKPITITTPQGQSYITNEASVVGGQAPTMPPRPDQMQQMTEQAVDVPPISAVQLGIPVQSNVDEARSMAKIEQDKTRLSEVNKLAGQYQNIGQLVDVARDYLNQGILGNTLKDRASMAAKSLGLSNTPEQVRTQAFRNLGENFVLARGSLGSGVSVADADRYDRAAGELSKAQSPQQAKAALDVLEEVTKKYAGQANQYNQSFQNTGQLPQYGQQSQGVSGFKYLGKEGG